MTTIERKKLKKKDTNSKPKKKRINWSQAIRPKGREGSMYPKRIKRSLQYILFLKKFSNNIDYKNIKLLKAFLNKYGKILPKRKTRVTVQQQRSMAKAIRKARAFGLIPFTADVRI